MPRVLTVQHQADAPPGLVGDWLADRGVRLEVFRPDLAMPLPESLRGYAGLLVLGGSMGAYDDHEASWLPRVRALFAASIREQVPALGICLGHQLLAVAAGGTVERHPDGRRAGTVELGLEPAAAADPLFGELRAPCRAVRWHQDVVVTPPADGTVLATGDGDIHGLRVGACAWGVQAHPEASADIVAGWAERAERQIRRELAPPESPGAGEPAEGVDEAVARVRAASSDIRARERELATVWRPFADAFADRLSARSPRGS